MALLAGVAADPAAAVTKATSAAPAMTAFDTTNLRVTFTAPANGKVLVRIRPCLGPLRDVDLNLVMRCVDPQHVAAALQCAPCARHALGPIEATGIHNSSLRERSPET
jgi:hypothetical protein